MAQEYTAALSKMWIFYTAVCGLMLISSLFIQRKRTLQTTASSSETSTAIEIKAVDVEKPGIARAV